MASTFRFEDFRSDDSSDSAESWDFDKNFIENIREIFNRSVYIPNPEIQGDIALSYCVVPSALCTRLPVLFLAGERGSGKSTLSTLIAGIQGQEIISAASTFASIRNHVATNRWYLPEEQREERNFCLLFDNVNPQTFSNEQLYTLFLAGYDRKTEIIKISKGDGQNMTFKVFAPKVISSIHALYSYPQLNELSRRLLTIRFKNSSKLEGFDTWYENRIDLDSTSLAWVHRQFTDFWSDPENCIAFVTAKKSLRKPKGIKIEHWAVSHDLIATGVATGIWESTKKGLLAFEIYWDWIDGYISNQGAIKQLLKSYFREQEVYWDRGLDRCIAPKELKQRIDLWRSEGKVEINLTTTALTQLMGDLGWHLGKYQIIGEKEDIYWLPND